MCVIVTSAMRYSAKIVIVILHEILKIKKINLLLLLFTFSHGSGKKAASFLFCMCVCGVKNVHKLCYHVNQ